MTRIKLVIPCFNEGPLVRENLSTILSAAQAHSASELEVCLLVVNDGSTDATLAHLQTLAENDEKHIEILSFISNFGKEAAIYAGLQFSAEADAVIVIDADLEHPPSLIPEMIKHWQAGYLVVEGKKRLHQRQSAARNVFAKLFYQSMASLTLLDLESESDFKLLDREVVVQYLSLPEKNRFFKGLVKWMNYPTKALYFDVAAGSQKDSRWSILGLFRYAVNALTSFSTLPLQLITLIGFLVFIVSGVFGAIAIYMRLNGTAVDGFTTVIVLQSLFSSAIMFSMGLIGVYIGKIYDELKNRPVFIVDRQNSRIDLNRP